MWKALDRWESVALNGTEDARTPFFSPDGRSIGFAQGNTGSRRCRSTAARLPQSPGATQTPVCRRVGVKTEESSIAMADLGSCLLSLRSEAIRNR